MNELPVTGASGHARSSGLWKTYPQSVENQKPPELDAGGDWMKKNVCLTQYSVTYKVIGKNSKPNHTIKKVDFKLQ